MKTFYVLENSIQSYAWGSLDGISNFTGLKNTTNKPMAEMWMGANPLYPSKIIQNSNADEKNLDLFIAENPATFLGTETASRSGGTLPFLFKVLSAASPLSLQVHPSKIQAEKGFERENREDILISAPERNYKDDNHKPEIILALTPFKAMCGFRKPDETIRLFSFFQNSFLSEALSLLTDSGEYTLFCKYLLELSPSDTCSVIADVIEKLTIIKSDGVQALEKTAYTLMNDLYSYYPSDIGVLSPLYLNILDLHIGEALYLPAGIMHAYIKGTGLELMASSDNVLRGGLTPKHIDIPELLSILNPLPFLPTIISPGKNTGIYHYKTPSVEFELSSVKVMNEKTNLHADYPAIIIGAEGTVLISAETGETCTVEKGNTFFIAATGETITFSGEGTCFMASIPDTKKLPQ